MIQVNNLSKNYIKADLKIPVLQELNLTIQDNESVAILGDSGSGKTTLLSLLSGLERPSEGSILIDDIAIEKLSQEELTEFRSARMSIVFQQYHLMDYLTAYENVTLPLEIKKDPEAKSKAQKVLEEVGLWDRKDHLPSQLSGGECQRVALARALVTGPSVLLADEPSGSLDSKTGQKVMDLLFDLKEKHQTTLILVTHNEELAKRCNRTLRMGDGKLI